jgi:hypothetical protein
VFDNDFLGVAKGLGHMVRACATMQQVNSVCCPESVRVRMRHPRTFAQGNDMVIKRCDSERLSRAGIQQYRIVG